MSALCVIRPYQHLLHKEIPFNIIADIAIGAPFEDDGIGSVYIYNGYTGGIWTKYTQRISGQDVGPNPPLHTFGSSITDTKIPFDFNGDKYGGIN